MAKNTNDPTSFDWNTEFKNIKSNFVRGATFRSMWKDEIIPGQVLYTDMQDLLSGGTYSELGITDEVAAGMDPTPDDDGITPDDALVIVDELMKPENRDLADFYATVYYTRYLEQNWNHHQNQQFESTQSQPQNRLKGKVVTAPDGRQIWSRS